MGKIIKTENGGYYNRRGKRKPNQKSIGIPKEIKIGSHTIPVKFVEDYMDGAMGLWDSEKDIIYIRNGMPESRTFTVFIHECLEAINDLYDLDLSHDEGEGKNQNQHWKLKILNEELSNLFNQLMKINSSKTNKR